MQQKYIIEPKKSTFETRGLQNREIYGSPFCMCSTRNSALVMLGCPLQAENSCFLVFLEKQNKQKMGGNIFSVHRIFLKT